MHSKLARRFKLLDRTGKGYVEEADYAANVRLLGAAFGHPEDSPVYQEMRDRYLGLWRDLAAQAGAGPEVQFTLDQFIEMGARSFADNPQGAEEVFQPLMAALVRLCDIDGDGRLSRQEVGRWLNCYGVSPEGIDEVFGRLDRDSDGYLSTEELLEAFTEYYTGNDPEAPGNWLLGPPAMT